MYEFVETAGLIFHAAESLSERANRKLLNLRKLVKAVTGS